MNYKFTIFVAMMLMSFVSKAQFDYSPLKPFVPTGMLFEQNPGHSSVHQTNYPSDYRVKIGEHQLIDIVLAPNAWARLHVENVNPQFGDRFRINWGGGQFRELSGPVNTELIFSGGGNINRAFTYTVERNGQPIQYHDTVWMLAWDTAYHKIEY